MSGVSIHPGMFSGDPHLTGHRLGVWMVCGNVWHESVQFAMETYELTREEVLTACWFAGMYGTDSLHRTRRPFGWRTTLDRKWSRRWRAWAISQHSAMWHGNWDDVTDPPSKAGA